MYFLKKKEKEKLGDWGWGKNRCNVSLTAEVGGRVSPV